MFSRNNSVYELLIKSIKIEVLQFVIIARQHNP